MIWPDDFENAAMLVRKELSPELVKAVKHAIENNEDEFRSMQHFGIGVAIRNLLRTNDFHWDDKTFGALGFDV